MRNYPRPKKRAFSRGEARRLKIYKASEKANGWVPCYVCGKAVNWADATVEHVLPKSRGGTNQQSNLDISHADCNNKRGDAMPERPSRVGSLAFVGNPPKAKFASGAPHETLPPKSRCRVDTVHGVTVRSWREGD